ncbi:MAG: hypothetical protein EB116_16835, partial [Betaproteobacteria bacterium]|nr:hypothetical protein [Betaproteobacteria bacterium]
TLRTKYLLNHYQYWIYHPHELEHRLVRLKDFMAAETFAVLSQYLAEGRMQDFVHQLLEKYYDPLYDRSIAKNYRARKNAISLDRLDHESLRALAQSLCQDSPAIKV